MAPAAAEAIKDAKSLDALRADIGGLMAELASRPQVNAGRRKLSGPERAAILMLALGEQYGGKIIQLLDDDELRELSTVMSSLGTIESESVEELLLEFVSRMSASGALFGNYDATDACTASWTISAGRRAATCGKSSPTYRKRCWRTS